MTPLPLDDLYPLVIAMLHRLAGEQRGDARGEIAFLVHQLEQLPFLDEIEQTAILIIKHHLHAGRQDEAAYKLCDVMSRRLFKTF